MNHIRESKQKLIREYMASIGYSNYKSVEYKSDFKRYYFNFGDKWLVIQKWLMDLTLKDFKENQ